MAPFTPFKKLPGKSAKKAAPFDPAAAFGKAASVKKAAKKKLSK